MTNIDLVYKYEESPVYTGIIKQDIPETIIKLPYTWTAYLHENSNSNWSIDGYYKIMKIQTNKNFWELLNNFSKFNYIDNQFFIMKEDVLPIWESCIAGGNIAMKIKMPNPNILEIWTNLCVIFMSNECSTEQFNVCGLSLNMKFDLMNIKILLSDMSDKKKVEELTDFLYNMYPKYNFYRMTNIGSKRKDDAIARKNAK